jgi:hypothetical protein
MEAIMRRQPYLLVALALLFVPAGAFAQKVTTDFDEKAAFGSFKTYAWTTGTPSTNPLGETRLHEAVDARLKAKGLALVQANPDVVVATHAVAKEEKQLYASGFGGGPRWGGSGTASVQSYLVGTLVLDIYDAKTKQLVWRGTGSDTLSDKADKNTAKVNKALDKMLKEFPPKPKK